MKSIVRKAPTITLGEIFCFVLVGISAGVCFRIVFAIHGNWDHLVQATSGILEGRPHWRAFQNRLLGPYLVAALASLGPPFKISLIALTAAFLFIHNVLLYAALRVLRLERRYCLLMVFVWSFIFIAIQDPRWIYIWDMIDLVIFTIISYALIFSRNLSFLWWLYPLALLNRESALFLPAAYLIRCYLSWLDTEEPFSAGAALTLLRQSALGVAMIIAGAIYTKFVRDALFIQQTNGGADAQNALLGNHIYLLPNLKSMLFYNFASIQAIITIPLWMSIFYFGWILSRTRDRRVQAGILFWFLWLGNIVAFGLINETRMLFPLVSLGIFIYVANENALLTRANA